MSDRVMNSDFQVAKKMIKRILFFARFLPNDPSIQAGTAQMKKLLQKERTWSY